MAQRTRTQGGIGRRGAAAAFAASFALATGVAWAAAGDLDTSFSGDGKRTVEFGTDPDAARGVVVQPNGRIVLAGVAKLAAGNDFALARLRANGNLDTSFSGNGKQTTSFTPSHDVGEAVAIQPDGKLVVAGFADTGLTGGTVFAVARYNPNGSLDTTFAGDGRRTVSFGPEQERAEAVAIHGGKIVVAGAFGDPGSRDIAVARLNANGGLDTTFSGDGKRTTSFSPDDDFGRGVAVQPNGRIVVAGQTVLSGANSDFAVARYNVNGSPDNTFSGNGKQVTPIGPGTDNADAMAIQPDGRIVAAGLTQAGAANRDFALVRYNPNGTPDTSFSGDGRKTTTFGPGNDGVQGIALQTDGRIVAAGDSGQGAGVDIAVARYNPNGNLDTAFSGNGKVLTPVGNDEQAAEAVAIKPSGQIVVAGAVETGGDGEFLALQYLP